MSRNDQSVLREHGVSGPLYDKMRVQERLTVPDIVELETKRVPDSFVIHYLASTEAAYSLSNRDIQELRRQGVSPAVAQYLAENRPVYDREGGPMWNPYATGYYSQFETPLYNDYIWDPVRHQ